MPKRSWVSAGVMGDLDEQPAHVAVSLFGDFSVVGAVGALVHARGEVEVTGELVRLIATVGFEAVRRPGGVHPQHSEQVLVVLLRDPERLPRCGPLCNDGLLTLCDERPSLA